MKTDNNNEKFTKWCHDFKDYTDKQFLEIREEIKLLKQEQHELVNEIKEYVDLKVKNEQ